MKRFTLPKDGGLIEAGLPNGIKHTFERIPAHIHEDEEAASKLIAQKIANEICTLLESNKMKCWIKTTREDTIRL